MPTDRARSSTAHHPAGHGPRLLILGRDGVLNVFREDHVKAPEEWTPVDGALPAVAKLNHAGWHVVVATNQSGIGRGMIDMASVNAIHAHMQQALARHGGRLDAVFLCPHAPEDECPCRKPRPGLLLDILQRYGAEAAEVPLVADNLRDLQAAQAAGCQPHLVRTGRASELSEQEEADMLRAVPGTRVHADLEALARTLLAGQAPADAGGEGGAHAGR